MAQQPILHGFSRREAVLGDHRLRGVGLCRELSAATDAWLAGVFESAVHDVAPSKAVALVALGGYGRAELAPFSDLDLLLLHAGERSIDELARRIWYPVWDAGIKLGHSVATPKQVLQLASSELDTATALLHMRRIAGDAQLVERLHDSATSTWRTRGRARLRELHRRVVERQQANGEVAFLLEPNLKEGYGGLCDVHSIAWAEAAGLQVSKEDRAALDAGQDVLVSVRVALHRHTRRAGEVLHLEDQDAVARACGYRTADALMAAISAAGRTIAWVTDEVWGRVEVEQAPHPPPRLVAPGVELRRGEVHLTDSADPAADPTLVLRVGAAAARLGVRIDREALDRLAELGASFPTPWPAGAVDELVALLLTGHQAIPVLEALDQRGLMVKLLPEWAPVRSRPQRNAYHRFTVDRHLWEATANAAELAERVRRPDLLVLGALLHDLGKGYPGDHTDAGMALVRRIGPRLGLPPEDVEVLVALVQHHLLLPDVATRRDLSDRSTISAVAAAVGSAGVLDLLHALTEADSLATGPSAWGSWKAELVEDLVDRVRVVVGGGDVRDAVWRLFPSPEVLATMAEGRTEVSVTDDRITVVTPDRPGTFSRIAGVLTLHGLGVLDAQAHSDEGGMAASQFRVAVPAHGIDWQPIETNMRRALGGELAIEARLAERAATYRGGRRSSAGDLAPPRVVVDDEASSNASVVEVRAPDRVGVLYRVTKALAELGLDIRHAKVQTLGDEVVDSFYVRTWAGDKLTDPFHRAELERALLHALSDQIGP